MKTIREAIEADARTIYLNNGVVVFLLDKVTEHYTYDPRREYKMIDGKRVYRWVFFTVFNPKDANLNAIKHGYMAFKREPYYLFSPHYYTRERCINEFINDNGGIKSIERRIEK